MIFNFNFLKRKREIKTIFNQDNNYNFSKNNVLEIVKKNFKLDLYDIHGTNHWERVFLNTQKLSKYYNIESEVFELFAILHDSQRLDNYADIEHGKRAKKFTEILIKEGIINLDINDQERLLFACENHTKPNKQHKLFKDLVIQICLDSDKMDIGRVGVMPNEKYFLTNYAKEIIKTYSKLLIRNI
jgi:uncharacterized protein